MPDHSDVHAGIPGGTVSVTLQQSCTLEAAIPKSAGAPGGGVAKEFVHLRDESAVLVSDWVRRGPVEFTCAVRWPAAVAGHRPDPVLAAQTVRQCGLAISHAEFNVPLDYQSLFRVLDLSIAPTLSPYPAQRNGPLQLTVDVRSSPPGMRGERITGSGFMEFTVRQGDHTVVRAESRQAWISPGVYRRLRGEHFVVDWGAWELPPPLEPAAVGCVAPAEVLLAAGDRPGRWRLRCDSANTAQFDHPVDHVPGLTLLAAAHQAARVATGAGGALVVTEVTTSYQRYVEFDAPCLLEAAVLPGRVEVTGLQHGRTAFRVGLTPAG
ncbi:ScbA/BarX family gamma-butyrolactone biosynthesis protein [Streptomyces sp. NPDC053048]|uniref:ScbA/BarX family gamma-butyrolactone biosynthesis protein n=1 Tax=Streptomyces sp. NPDC053048 TaxID=3365694 RepID=UPI0037CDD93F